MARSGKSKNSKVSDPKSDSAKTPVENENALQDAEVAGDPPNTDVPDPTDVPDQSENNAEQNEQAPPVAQVSDARRRPWLGLVLGGAVAAALGVGVTLFVTGGQGILGQANSQIEVLTEKNVQLSADVLALQSEITTLTAMIAGSTVSSDLAQISTKQNEILQSLAARETAMADLVTRLTDLENRPIPDIGATEQAVATYERELASMRQMFEQELKRIQDAEKSAISNLQTATSQNELVSKQVAFSALKSAAETGNPFLTELADARRAGLEITGDLDRSAQAGVQSLAELQDLFPQAARAVLEATNRLSVEAGSQNRLTAFLRNQLGVRSLDPRDGDDPDAILSRAEDALRKGEIDKSVAELGNLPDMEVQELTNWLALAGQRQAVMSEITALAESLGF